MNNINTESNKFQKDFSESRRDLLESTKLSRLSKIPKRTEFKLPKFELPIKTAVCVNCKVKLDEYNQPLKYANVCRKCILCFTIVETELDTADKRKRQELLKRFIGGGK